MTTVLAQRLTPLATPLVNKFYDEVGARGRATKQDQVWVIRCDNNISAAARVANIDEHAFICGVYVAPEHRNQGQASNLIRQICAELDAPIYTFIYQHLEDFYLQLGFIPVQQELPAPLLSRLHAYQNQGRKILPYCFVGEAHG
ncbi:GNAT family N-acetyltransferase [Pseudoalteromonas sp. YIC-656]|uniref:GNAT family N-acetyltransferase n=1 Tax=Pseudoalteromonas pernae TaxID=3118054 RepID=UPI003242BB29